MSWKFLLPILVLISSWTFNASAETKEVVANEEGNYFDLFAILPPFQITWASPRMTLLRYYASHTIAQGDEEHNLHELGHGMGRVHCTDSKGQDHNIFVSLTGENDPQIEKDNIYINKIGFKIMLYAYDDGNIEPSEESEKLLSEYQGRFDWTMKYPQKQVRTPIRFMRFPISTPQQCDQALEYYNAFYDKAHEQPKTETYKLIPDALMEQQLFESKSVEQLPNSGKLWFGFGLDSWSLFHVWKQHGGNSPDNKAFLGGGCSSFVIGFLKAIDAYDPEFDDLWKTKIKIHSSAIGEEGHPVSLKKILFSGGTSYWSPDSDQDKEWVKDYKLDFYDPEKIWHFMDAVASCHNWMGEEPVYGLENPEFTRCSGKAERWYRSHVKNGKMTLSNRKLEKTTPRLSKNAEACDDKNDISTCEDSGPIWGLKIEKN